MVEIPPPAELSRLAALIGGEATLRLIEAHGGTRIFVPARPNQGHPLARTIGLEAARALAAEWGSTWLKVPLCRHWRVRVYRARGESYKAIARRLGMDESGVWRILHAARMTGEARQTDLFSET
ncbi:hypothetical protein GCM10010964_18460 [Caldovatus sediminis]|uniref:Mor transcription activator domain-containing protein n=1 Tax=Caldovatus sediminis TaxID=2041189 RepID=A0A8J2ZAR2_9PROT|nr:hypothetical protein [Caldovatus sediminis]GGG30850.1 hypothetical protein GCM10010964_18460 [Caldovatus sediminis]